MCTISDELGSDLSGASSWEDGDDSSFIDGKLQFKDLARKANSVSILNIFNNYNLKVSESNRKIVCPFPKHKGGKEITGSFLYYPKTNTFWCFGCHTGTTPIDFVSVMENISKTDAANKILKMYSYNADEEFSDLADYSHNFEELVNFSNYVREIMRNNSENEDFVNFVEKNTSSFDNLNSKYRLDDNALKLIISNIKQRIDNYLCRF